MSIQTRKSAKRCIVLILAVMCLLLTSGCGGGSMATPLVLGVVPASSNIFTNFESQQFTTATLSATLSDGTVPVNVQWTTSNGCVAPGNNLQNTTTVVCNFTCGD